MPLSREEKARQAQEAYEQHGTHKAAARSLGIAKSTLQEWLHLNDRPPLDPVGEGYYVKGVSTLVGEDGETKAQWIKTNREAEDQTQALQEFAESLSRHTPASPIIERPNETDSSLQTTYPLFDEHFGLYSWHRESGENFDLNEAYKRVCGGIDDLIMRVPPSEQGVIVNGGDWFHLDDSTNETPESHNKLDVDGRFTKVVDVGEAAMVHCVDRALQRHGHVKVYSIPGNHDPHLTPLLAKIIAAHYRNEPRVEVVVSPALCQYHRFGKNLFGFHHGHKIKAQDLPLVMASDCRVDWAETLFQYWLTGHIHHKTMHEVGGVPVESFRTPTGRDAFHAGKGYRAGQDLCALVHDYEDGEVMRLTSSLRRVERRAVA